VRGLRARRRAADAPTVALTFNPAAPAVLVKPAPAEPEPAVERKRRRVPVRPVAGAAVVAVLAAGAVAMRGGGEAPDGISSPEEASGSVQMVVMNGGCGSGRTIRPDLVEAAWGATGFVIAPEYVMTNAHVVDNVSRPTFADLPAAVVLYDDTVDLAVLHVPGLALPPLKFDAADKGDTVTVAGFGGRPKLREAKVKGFLRNGQVQDPDDGFPAVHGAGSVLIDRPLIPGDSGGPWLTKDGDVAGVSALRVDGRSLWDRLRFRSFEDKEIGLAVAAGIAAEVAAKGIGLTAPVKVPGCPS
jgi:S1-C subfamily serine protease